MRCVLNSTTVNISRWVHLFKEGLNQPRDGRKAFMVDADAAAETIKDFKDHGGYSMDYVHASLNKDVPAPFPERFIKSGDMIDAEWRPGKGLYFLTNFTERGSGFIAKGEMNAASAEAFINPKTNKLYRISGATLCNRAALALDPILYSEQSDNQTIKNEAIELDAEAPAPATNLSAATAAGVTHMSKLSEVAILLGETGESPDVEQIAEKGLTRLNAYKAAADVIALAVGLDPKVCTLSEIGNAVKDKIAQAEQFDPTKFTTIEKFNEVQLLVETEKKASAEKENELKLLKAEDAVRPFTVGEVKITPAMKPFAIKQYLLGEDNFKEYVSGLTPVVTLTQITDDVKTAVTKVSVGKQMALDAAKADPSIKLVEQPSSAKE